MSWRPAILVAALGALLPAHAEITVDLGKGPRARKLELGSMQFVTTESFAVEKGESLPGDAYVFAKTARIDGTIRGDLHVATPTAEISGTITGDLQVASSMLGLRGTLGDDLRAVTSNGVIDAQIAGDVLIYAGNLEIFPETHIAGAVVIGAGRVELGGRVDGPVRIDAGSVRIVGQINGDVTIACDELEIDPNAKIAGNLTYSAREAATVAPGAVAGAVNRTESDPDEPEDKAEDEGSSVLWFAIKHIYLPIVSVIAGILLVIFFGRFTNASLGQAATSSGLGTSFGIGFVAVLVLVMVGAVCCVLVPMALAVWSLLGALFYFGGLIGKMLAGQWLLRPLAKERVHPILSLLVGVFVIELFSFIPLLSVLVPLGVIFTGIGAVLMQLRSIKQGEEVEGMPQLP